MTDYEDCNHVEKENKFVGISPQSIKEMFSLRHPATIHLLQFFADKQYAPEIIPLVVPLRIAVFEAVDKVPDGPELTVALRKALGARDAIVRYFLAVNNFGMQ